MEKSNFRKNELNISHDLLSNFRKNELNISHDLLSIVDTLNTFNNHIALFNTKIDKDIKWIYKHIQLYICKKHNWENKDINSNILSINLVSQNSIKITTRYFYTTESTYSYDTIKQLWYKIHFFKCSNTKARKIINEQIHNKKYITIYELVEDVKSNFL